MAKSQILAAIIHITRRAARRKCSVVTAILLTFFLFPLFLYFLLGYAIANDPRLVPHAIRNAQNVLFITAHPDDGPLFFGPSILQAWGKGNVNRYVLVLSSEGNSDDHADKQRLETKASCAEFGIPEKRCIILENNDPKDDSRKLWDEQKIESVVERHVKKWVIDLIITFDEYGMSSTSGGRDTSHHRSVSKGVERYTQTHHDDDDGEQKTATYALQTKSVLRKYLALADLIPTSFPFMLRILEAIFMPVPNGYLTPMSGKKVPPPKDGDLYADKALIVSDWSRLMKAQTALGKHASQYSWNRVLYSALSRHMWFNDLRRM